MYRIKMFLDKHQLSPDPSNSRIKKLLTRINQRNNQAVHHKMSYKKNRNRTNLILLNFYLVNKIKIIFLVDQCSKNL